MSKNDSATRVDIGLDDNRRRTVAEELGRVLADSYTLYLKTHNFHWNVTGPMFTSLHQMFEEQYRELAGAVDEVAERIRTLGEPAPGSYKQFAELGRVREQTGVPEALDMVRELTKDHETVARTSREAFQQADEAGDEPTADLLVQRMQVHEKTAWMLRSLLQ